MILDDSNIGAYLAELGLAERADAVQVLSAGDGNINFVRRVRVGPGRSVVVKQARKSLERFPEYQVSTTRIVFEHRYAEVVAELAPGVAETLPRTLAFDEKRRVLVLEDLGDAPRLDRELALGRVPIEALNELGVYLASVHAATRPLAATLRTRFENHEMRELHGEHIFTLPYQANDFPLSPELHAAAERLLDAPVRASIAELRESYYQSCEALVHADVQAGNLLLQGQRPRLLDAEIAHLGDPAFDLGTALAHVWVYRSRSALPDPCARGAEALCAGYRSAGGSDAEIRRAARYAGVEILRRTIGAARLAHLAEDADAIRALGQGAQLALGKFPPGSFEQRV